MSICFINVDFGDDHAKDQKENSFFINCQDIKLFQLVPIFGNPPRFLAFAAFIRRMFASMLLVLGGLDPSNFPEPVF